MSQISGFIKVLQAKWALHVKANVHLGW